MSSDAHVAACWEIAERFCASFANGRERCKKGTCSLLDSVPELEEADGPSARQVGE